MKNPFKKEKVGEKAPTKKVREPLVTVKFEQTIVDGKITEERYCLMIDTPAVYGPPSYRMFDCKTLSPRQYQDLVNAIKEREGLIEVVNEKE